MSEKELDLNIIRQEIDEVDQKLAAALEARLNLVMQVAEYKKNKGLQVKDRDRERAVIEKVAGLMQDPKYVIAAKNIMRGIIDQACLLEESKINNTEAKILEIACFGPEASFTHQALETYFADRKHNRHHFNSFEEVIASVNKGEMDYAVLPIENSSTGGITDVYDLLRQYDCSIVGEQCVRIVQNLMACKGASLETIKTVYSHPQGFLQTKEFFKKLPDVEKVPFFSTAKSAQEVSAKKDLTLAAIASNMAAELYGLEVIAPAINYNTNNTTRFVIIAKKPEYNPLADKITMILAVKHETGSLYKLLASFYHTGLNMLNLESRPMGENNWEYYFFIDVTGNLADPVVKDLMEEIQDNITYCKILGNYKANREV
mgnify:FL=1